MFIKQHFEAIADIIHSNSHIVGSNEQFDNGALFAGSNIADELCKLFKADNPRFDSQQFQRACGFS